MDASGSTPPWPPGRFISSLTQIVKAHGGTLQVRSTEAEGTCFWLTLPRHPPPLDRAWAPPTDARSVAPRPTRVLVRPPLTGAGPWYPADESGIFPRSPARGEGRWRTR
ncbi:hypothetical protein DAT35_15725 [Vitiosangium sp. GDMCC 1.1324]|nr:hypothetical protein DAT35_15725 [Vitiosangium sp. GDMCC 1.1324]